jgi:hypothetical protein
MRLLLLLILPASLAWAGQADVINAEAQRTAENTYRFAVTVRHADSGWDHYADRWDVLAPDGTVLGTRVLLHPHETEQPFTRSLSGVVIPQGIHTVEVRAHDSEHGYGGASLSIELPPR